MKPPFGTSTPRIRTSISITSYYTFLLLLLLLISVALPVRPLLAGESIATETDHHHNDDDGDDLNDSEPRSPPGTTVLRQRLRYVGDVDPAVVHRYDVHVNLNRANYEPKGPPSLAQRASALLGSEFLALIHPPMERTLRNPPLATIAPTCVDAQGGGIDCRIENYVVFEGRMGFNLALSYAEYSLPGMERPEELEKDSMGYPPPHKGATMKVLIDVLDEKDNGHEALEGIVEVISEMFGVENPMVSLVEVEHKERSEGEANGPRTVAYHDQRGSDEL